MLTDAQRIDALRALEELKSATEALQAEITADFKAPQRTPSHVPDGPIRA